MRLCHYIDQCQHSSETNRQLLPPVGTRPLGNRFPKLSARGQLLIKIYLQKFHIAFCVPLQADNPPLPAQSIRSSGCRFARRDPCRTWNTGNFGPDAICFSVDRRGIAIAGAVVYSGTGSYEYQLELLYDSLESHTHHKWETIESISGSYDQDVVQNEMAEIKFERPVHIKVKEIASR